MDEPAENEPEGYAYNGGFVPKVSPEPVPAPPAAQDIAPEASAPLLAAYGVTLSAEFAAPEPARLRPSSLRPTVPIPTSGLVAAYGTSPPVASPAPPPARLAPGSYRSTAVLRASRVASFGVSAAVPGEMTGVVQLTPDLLPPAIGEPTATPLPTKPLRVAHVGPFFLRGGAEQWLLDLIRHVDRRYLRFIRFVSTYHELVDLAYVEQLASYGVALEVGGPESVQKAANDADVLLSWGVELDSLLGDVRPRLSLQTVHGDGPTNRHFLERSRASIDHAVAVSHRVKAYVCEGVPTTVIYNGVDAGRIAPSEPADRVRRRLGFAESDFVVGYVGRFAPEKRPQAVIDAVARLPARFKALLVGWGRLLPELRQQAEERIPGRYVITHAADGIGDLYRAADAVCLTSDQEGFPMVLLEAMLCGRPMISTPVGCVPEVVEHRVNGLHTTGDPDDLAACLAQLADHPRWAAALAAEGLATAERFGFARRMARDYERLLHDLWRRKTAEVA